MSSCVVVGLFVAHATFTQIHYVFTDTQAIGKLDPHKHLWSATGVPRHAVRSVTHPGPRITPEPPRYRCGFESLYASLTGEHIP